MKTIKIYVVGLLLSVAYSVQAKSLEDSIYADIYNFVVKMEGSEFEAMHPEISKDSYRSWIYIYDILDTLETDSNINFTRPIGVYIFNYVGLDNKYVLIKFNKSFTVFKKIYIYDIIDELLSIQRKEPELLTDNLLVKYIQRLTKRDNESVTLVVKIGVLEYIFNSVNDYYW